jgi:RimJ/RimL family protein N-acetyltransferase
VAARLSWCSRPCCTPCSPSAFGQAGGRAGLAFAFETLAAEEVVAFTEVHNHASRAVMARLGMTQIGQIYRPGLLEGRTGIHNAAPFALYRINRNQSSVRTKLS